MGMEREEGRKEGLVVCLRGCKRRKGKGCKEKQEKLDRKEEKERKRNGRKGEAMDCWRLNERREVAESDKERKELFEVELMAIR